MLQPWDHAVVGEVHLFVLWSAARPHEAEIVADIESTFRLLDLVEVTWTASAFGQNLTTFYGAALPPDSHKEQHAGTGPFLVAVVEDEHPRQRFRRMGSNRRWVSARVIDARARYRAMTGGGYRVHASESAVEANRDLVLLFGRPARSFLRTGRAGLRRHVGDIVGANGWRSESELLLALDVVGGARRVEAPPGVDLQLEVGDEWWARELLRRPGSQGEVEVEVGGGPVRIGLVERQRRVRIPTWLPPALARTRVPA